MNTPNEQAVTTLRKMGFDLIPIRQALLKLSGITEPELAEKCGLTRPTVNAYINGRRARLKTQVKIAKQLGVRPDILFDEWAEAVAKAGVPVPPETDNSQCAA